MEVSALRRDRRGRELLARLYPQFVASALEFRNAHVSDLFNLSELPFRLTPDPEFLYLSKAHARAKAYMESTVWSPMASW